MSDEIDSLRAELAAERARRMALEAVFSTNEHLILKSPVLKVFDRWNSPPWGVPAWESWRVEVQISRRARSGQEIVDRIHDWFDAVPVRAPPRVLFCVLPEVSL